MGRPLTADEQGFLESYFGTALDLARVRVGLSLGRRCWSPYGSRISMIRACFDARDPGASVNLADPRVAATFAHEAVHVWQRQHGVWVTARGAVLQTGYITKLANPYRYESSEDPEHMLARFDAGNIEQQGSMFQDYVLAHRSGADVSRFAGIAERCRQARPRSG